MKSAAALGRAGVHDQQARRDDRTSPVIATLLAVLTASTRGSAPLLGLQPAPNKGASGASLSSPAKQDDVAGSLGLGLAQLKAQAHAIICASDLAFATSCT